MFYHVVDDSCGQERLKVRSQQQNTDNFIFYCQGETKRNEKPVNIMWDSHLYILCQVWISCVTFDLRHVDVM